MEPMRITRATSSGLSLAYGDSSMRRLSFWGVMCALWVIGPLQAVLCAQNYLTSTGTSSFSTPYPVAMGTVDAASGNLHLEIPLGSFAQRGGSALVPKLLYDSHIWTVPTDGTSQVWTTQGALYGLAFGTWGFAEGGTVGAYGMKSSGSQGCNEDLMLWSQSGAQHYFNIPGTWTGFLCTGGTAYAADSSGYYISQTAWGSGTGVNATISVYAPDGTQIYGSNLYSYSVTSKDSNGNYLGLTNATIVPPGIFNPVTDTLGRKVVNPTGVGSPTTTLAVMNSQGGTSNYVVTTSIIPVKTNFQQSGVTECNNNCTATVITCILLPDNTSYSFLYDCDKSTGNLACSSYAGQSGYYGTLTYMILPSGSIASYSYSNFTDAQGGVSRWLTSYDAYSELWSYAPIVTVSNFPNFQQNVTVTKPDYSKDVI